jgi:hypothetical protein
MAFLAHTISAHFAAATSNISIPFVPHVLLLLFFSFPFLFESIWQCAKLFQDRIVNGVALFRGLRIPSHTFEFSGEQRPVYLEPVISKFA